MPHSIVVPASDTSLTYDLTTVAAVNEALGIAGNTADDADTQDEITQASKLIADKCDRVFALQTVVETFMLHETWLHGLTLRHYPVSDIASITVSGVALVADDYKVEPDSGVLWRWGTSACSGWRSGEVVVTYTAGYDLPEAAPAALAAACIAFIEDSRSGSSSAAAAGIRDIQHGDRRISYFDTSATASRDDSSLPAAVADLIRPFRRRNV